MKTIWFEPKYIMRIGIVFFYLFDYYYLYTFMNKEYSRKQKKELSYWLGDFLISIFLLIAFKAIHSPEISYFCLAFIPILFLWNSCELEKNEKNKEQGQSTSNKFDKKFALVFYLVGGVIYISGHCMPCIAKCSNLILSYFILIMIFWHGKFVMNIESKKQNKVADFNKKEYEIVNIEKFEEIFKERMKMK